MPPLPFTKMHSLGNDFMVVDGVNRPFKLSPAQISNLSDRHTGIGFDQCLVVETSSEPGIDFNYRIYNADGSEVGQCGNGARCLAKFIQHHQLSSKKSFKLATKTTILVAHLKGDIVSIHLSPPQFSPSSIPFIYESEQNEYVLSVHGQQVKMHVVNVGNPHVVIPVMKFEEHEIAHLGKAISEHDFFPEQTNVGFMIFAPPNQIRLRVYERGCGETLACGSGAVAAAVVARKYYVYPAEISIELRGGMLAVSCPDLKKTIELSGPAEFVYEGSLDAY